MMGKMARVLAKTQWYQTMQVVILFSTITHLQLKKKYFQFLLRMPLMRQKIVLIFIKCQPLNICLFFNIVW